ncbi:uncharacterized protein VTP21DRAFT_3490 [Calcarisporiella thermophila]|uniref:uncharacterized protein n=1 Tax=Calcarisporiella thermophila TaxID=911321 RepID=UPI0037449CF4
MWFKKHEYHTPQLRKAISTESFTVPPLISTNQLPVMSKGDSFRKMSCPAVILTRKSQPYVQDGKSSIIIAVLGRKGVGKSTLIRLGLDDAKEYRPQDDSASNAAYHACYYAKNNVKHNIKILELGEGFVEEDEKDSIYPLDRWKEVESAHGIIVCFDLNLRDSTHGIYRTLYILKDLGIPIVLVGCKSDGFSRKRQVDTKMGPKLASTFAISYKEVDANSNKGLWSIRELFVSLITSVLSHSTKLSVESADTMSNAPNPESYKDSKLKVKPPLIIHSLNSRAQVASAESGKRQINHSQSLHPTLKHSARTCPHASSTSNLLNHFDEETELLPNSYSFRRRGSDFTVHAVYPCKWPPPDPHEENLQDNLEPPVVKGRRGSKDSNESSAGGQTIGELIDRLVNVDMDKDDLFCSTFLMSYRRFMRPLELLTHLIDRFHQECDDRSYFVTPVQKRITDVIAEWVLDYWNDFIHADTRKKLHIFLEYLSANEYTQPLCDILAPLIIKEPCERDLDNCWGLTDYSNNLRSSTQSSSSAISEEEFTHITSLRKDSGYISPTTISGIAGEKLPVSDLPAEIYAMISDRIQITPTFHLGEGLLSGITPDGTPLTKNTTPPLSRQVPSSINSEYVAHRKFSTASSYSTTSMQSGIIERNDENHKFAGASSSSLQSPKFAGGDATILALILPLPPSGFVSNKRRGSLPTSESSSTLRISRRPSFVSLTANRKAFSAIVNPDPFQSILELSAMEIASQLTWIEFELFRKIKPRDMIQQVMGSGEKDQKRISRSMIPNVSSCSSHFNFVSAWTATMVLSQPKLKQRARTLEKFMQIAQSLRELNNFNTLTAVLAALNNGPVGRLTQTFAVVRQRPIYQKYQGLVTLMSSDRSYQNYRLALKGSTAPCVPYLGVHLKDLVSIAEGNPDFKEGPNIHWKKFQLMGDTIFGTVRRFQRSPYTHIKLEPEIIKTIAALQLWSDDFLYDRSLELEPRVPRSSLPSTPNI